VTTVAFEGIEARAVDVQVQIGPGLPAFTIVGLPDKAVAESRERVRGTLNAMTRAAAEAYHGQSRSRRPPERGEPLRPSRRARADGGDRSQPWPAPCPRRSGPTRSTLRVARTLADLDGEEKVARIHIAEALSYRGETLRRAQAAA
jgi:magnesium chelatase subunit ChlI-like protein/Mg-chelatase subunit ChlI-like protein